VRGQIANVLSWSANKKDPYRPVGPNPAAWYDNLEHKLLKPGKLTKIEHRPALPWQDLREFMAAPRQDTAIAARALEFAILTAMRTDEVRLAPWSEIDLKRQIGKIPSGRVKSDRPHRVPLSDAAIQILLTIKGDAIPDKHDLVFALPTGRLCHAARLPPHQPNRQHTRDAQHLPRLGGQGYQVPPRAC
jgi:integrase